MLRGAHHDSRQVYLLACMDHASHAVLAQRQVDGAPGEVPGLQPLLADLDLADVVDSADALETHPQAAEFLVSDKQPPTCWSSRPASRPCWTAASACLGSAWPVLDPPRDRGHGRIELRTLKGIAPVRIRLGLQPSAAEWLRIGHRLVSVNIEAERAAAARCARGSGRKVTGR